MYGDICTSCFRFASLELICFVSLGLMASVYFRVLFLLGLYWLAGS